MDQYLQKNKNKTFSLFMLLTVAIIAPLNNDIFISSFPEINTLFQTKHAHWILSFGLISIAFAQLFCGALMDRFGRKSIMISGLLLFSISDLGVLYSSDFSLMLACRVLQSIGASCSIVGAVAIAKDSAPKDRLVYYTAFIFGIVSISPFIAPTIGSYLQNAFHWKGSFTFLFIVGIFYLLLFIPFKESIKIKDDTHIKKLIDSYVTLLKNRKYCYYIIINCMSYILIFTFIATSPIIIIHQFKFSVIDFGYIFLLFSFSLLAMNIITPKLSIKFGIKKVIYLGTIFILSGMTLLLILSIYETNLFDFMFPMIVAGIGCGMIRPAASAAVMQLFPSQYAGKTIALYNFMFYFSAGITTLFSSKLALANLNFLALFLFVIATIAFIFSSKLKKLCIKS